MIAAPIPIDEAERIADLRALEILDTPPEDRFDGLVRLASRLFGVPVAYIALVDADRQWFKARCGLTAEQTPRNVSFCGHAVAGRGPFIVPDASRDERFHDNPFVTGEPHIRFYAGIPLAGPTGHNVGTFCIAGPTPRDLDDAELGMLRELAALAQAQLNMLDVIRAQRELIRTKNELLAVKARLDQELAEAAEYVGSLLPPRMDGPVRTDWRFICSSRLGGDLFGYHWLDGDRLAIYLFDVSGHGVGAALMSASVHSMLRRKSPTDALPEEPAEVLAALNRAFPMDENNNKFVSVWYGVYHLGSRLIRFAGAGHPPAIVFAPGDPTPQVLSAPNLLIGIDPQARYTSAERVLAPGSRMYVFSDGVFEVQRPDGTMLAFEELIDLLAEEARGDGSRVDRVLQRVYAIRGSSQLADDFSLLEVELP